MSNRFFTSDEHYGHVNMLKFANRPFKTIEEQTEILIENHNKKVKPGDLTYHLGDIFWRTLTLEQAWGIRKRLNGQHYFVWGNHDELLEDNLRLRAAFVWCKDIAVVECTPKIVLCHYAMQVWRGSHRGTWQLFGHTHNQLTTKTLSFDVGVDSWNYEPVSYDEVVAKMKTKIALGHGDPLAANIKKNTWGEK